jgi:hypothetical protein
MMKRLSNMSLCLVFAVTVASLATAAGCGIGHRQEVKTEVVVPDYVTQAIEATGGRQAWTKTKKLEFDCVVTFYNADGTYYLTEQHHQILPWANSIQISATEPPTATPYHCYEEEILDMMTTPVRLLDSNDIFTKRTSPVKRQGLWYYPIEQDGSEKLDTKYDKVVFYQNTDSSLVDTICFVGTNQQAGHRGIAVRGYDYRKVESNGVLVPGRIEIFKTDDWGRLRQRLVKIDYK